MNEKTAAGRLALLLIVLSGVPLGVAEAVAPRKPEGLAGKQFVRSELLVFAAGVPLAEVIERLPNRAAWQSFASSRAADSSAFQVFVDPRSGTAANLMGPVPLIPGSGVGNGLTMASLARKLGRPVEGVDAAVVADAVRAFVQERRQLLGIDTTQMGAVRATAVTADLWHVNVPQQYRGVPVRNAHVVGSISHGNLVTIGALMWSTVRPREVTPAITAEDAVAAGFAYAEGRTPADQVVDVPVLEIVPALPAEHPFTARFSGPVGEGYRHRLVWTFSFRRLPDAAQWEVTVDADSGEVLSFQDRNQYARRQVNGGVYPVVNTESCPDTRTCGVLQSGWPMPFADTGFPAPNNLTNSAGVFEFTSGTGITTLSGRYFDIQGHAPLSESGFLGQIGLGGVNGQHDLTSSGSSAGDTAAARTAFYELNKIAEMARGYLPLNESLRGEPVVTHVNVDDACNAFYLHGPQTLNFFRSGQDPFDAATTCRNTGEMAAVLDHEWGHWLDDDHDGNSSRGGEAYADIAALYRTQTSCLGPGFHVTNSDGCGVAPDGTGFNVNMSADGSSHCATNCSGVREADWTQHVPAEPDNFSGFVRHHCLFDPDNIELGFSVHCVAAPVDQMAWDLVTRDLTAAPFNMDSQTAFIVANKLFYQAGGGIFQWVNWVFFDGPTDGCSPGNGYIEWLVADDDNGSLADGTPHMTAIFNAFDRHGMGCAMQFPGGLPDLPPAPVNSGCAQGPAAAPAVTATASHYRTSLSWTAVPGATRYRVFRSEGHAGCNYGKALIAEVTGLSYTDTEVAAGRPYFYNVMAAGQSSACFGAASACVSATPTAGNYTIACSPSTLNFPGGNDGTCTVTSTGGYDSAVTLGCSGLPSGASCQFNPPTVTPAPNGSVNSTVSVTAGPFTPFGTHAFNVQGTPRALPVVVGNSTPLTLVVAGGGSGANAAFDPHLRVPVCATVGASCDTGTVLVRGRGTLGPEPNRPNTLAASCADGSAAVSPFNGSNDRIRVFTSGGSFAPGKTVRIDATVNARADFASDAADFFYAADASNPSWVLADTVVPSAGGVQTLSAKYKLPVGALQAVRVQFRRLGSSTPCAPGTVNERDDLVFAVGN